MLKQPYAAAVRIVSFLINAQHYDGPGIALCALLIGRVQYCCDLKASMHCAYMLQFNFVHHHHNNITSSIVTIQLGKNKILKDPNTRLQDMLE